MRLARPAVLAVLFTLALAPAANAHGNDEGDVNHTDTGAELAAADINHTIAIAGMAQTVAPDLPQYLPITWCGNEQAADDTAHAVFAASQRQVKVVYAYAGDPATDDHFDDWKDALQADVSRIEQYLALQTGGRRALRFDMGTACGPQYVDLQVVHLPQPRAYYVDSAYNSDPTPFNHLANDVAAALGPLGGPRDVFILAEGLTDDLGVWGVAQVTGDDRAGADNVSNDGGFTASMWTNPGTAPSATGWQPTVMLHEITHNLGGVEQSAPHHTAGWHCWDGADVMCYDDGSAGSENYTTTMCPSSSGDIPDTYDCGHDDYFNPDPPANSYLATHWNLYDSDFFGACTQLGMACGSDVVPTVPVNTALPTVTGPAQLGTVLVANAGTWLNRPTIYRLQWQRTARANWIDIAGATWTSYVPTAADVGASLRVVVTAANEDGSAIIASGPTAPVVDGRAAPPPAKPKALAKGTLRIALRDRRRHTAGTLAAKVRAVKGGREVSTAATRVTLPAGTWRLKLCAGPKRGSLRCALSARVRARTDAVRLPAARVKVKGSSGALRVTAAAVDGRQRVRATGQAATA
jgi:hypothetical protein